MEINELYKEHGHHSFFDFWHFMDDQELSEEEFAVVKDAAAAWSTENEIPCELTRLDDGFRVELVHLCHSGSGLAGNLFITLARNAFRQIDKGFAYGPRREPTVQ